jgi:hypothetical protein
LLLQESPVTGVVSVFVCSKDDTFTNAMAVVGPHHDKLSVIVVERHGDAVRLENSDLACFFSMLIQDSGKPDDRRIVCGT